MAPTHELLEQVADEVDASVGELKRIVRDLRPTALDQLGLVGAVAEFTRGSATPSTCTWRSRRSPLELPAAVEVATYRIVTEAVTNVVRHARAATCWLTITAGPSVVIDVVDDGVGIAAGERHRRRAHRDARAGGGARWVRAAVAEPATRHPRPRHAAGGAAVTNPLRVAIVDDHPMFRMGLAAAIAEMDGIELVGEAQRADQVAALVAGTSPDVLLLDLRSRTAPGWRSTAGSPPTTRMCGS